MKRLNQRLFYGQTMTVYRQGSSKNADGSVKLGWTAIAESEPCKLSKKTLDTGGRIREDVNPVQEVLAVFCDPAVEVMAGDLLEIDGVRYRSGAPFQYPAHQEIIVTRKDLAQQTRSIEEGGGKQ